MNKKNVLRTWSLLKLARFYYALSYPPEQEVCTACVTASLYKGVGNSCRKSSHSVKERAAGNGQSVFHIFNKGTAETVLPFRQHH